MLERASTVTPGSTDPSEAVTVPTMVPVCCANSGDESATRDRDKSMRKARENVIETS
jgi:hypothetical protein